MATNFSKEVTSQPDSRLLREQKSFHGYIFQLKGNEILIAQVVHYCIRNPHQAVTNFIELDAGEYTVMTDNSSWAIVHVWAVPRDLAKQFVERE